MFNEILDKFATSSKKNSDNAILTKDNAKDAITELYEKKLNDGDGYKAQEQVKKNFEALWEANSYEQRDRALSAEEGDKKNNNTSLDIEKEESTQSSNKGNSPKAPAAESTSQITKPRQN